MSQPNPVYVEFAIKSFDKVIQAMKSLEETVLNIEKSTTAAAKAGAKARASAKKTAADSEAAAAVAAANTATVADKHANDVVKKAATQVAKDKIAAWKLADRYAAGARASGEQAAVRSSQVEAQAALKAAQAKIAAYKMADKAAASARSAGEKEAKKAMTSESKIDSRLRAQANIARREIRKGETSASPALSPQGRLAMLHSAAGKSPEERARIADKIADMTVENRDRRGARVKMIEEGKKAQIAADKEVAQKKAQSDSAAAKQKRADIAAWNKVESDLTKANKSATKAAGARQAKEQRRREKAADNLYGTGERALSGSFGAIGSMARGVANLGGGFSIEDSLQREVSLRGRASQIATTTQTGISADSLLSNARDVGIKNAIDPEAVLRAYENVKKLNDGALPQAIRVMPHLAQIATATGADTGDLGSLAANIISGNQEFYNNKGISNDEKDKTLKRQVRVFANQGIHGGVEIDDFAHLGARITAGATLFGGNREEAEADLGAAAQIARQRGGATNATEATMSAQRFATDLQKKAGSLKALGIDVADKDGSLRGLDDITIDMLRKQSTVTGIPEFAIGERGNRFLTGAADMYRQAGGGDAGETAVREFFKNMRKDLGEDNVVKMATARNSSEDKQLEAAMIELRTVVGKELVPALPPLIRAFVKLMPTITSVVEGLGKLATVAANNPILGLGAIISGYFVKELASAQIAEVIKKGLAGLFSGGGGGGGGGGAGAGGGPGKGGGIVTALGAGLAAGAATLALVKPGIDAALQGQSDGAREAGTYIASLKNGSDPEKQAALKSYLAKQDEWGGVKGIARLTFDAQQSPGGTVYSTVTGDKNPINEDIQKGMAAREVLADPQLLALVKELVSVTRQNGNAPQGPPVQQTTFSRGPGPTTTKP